jgi:NADPH-dependent 2,4-dienoyl-CoA reductase/sulfur reductase-like enzyme
MTAAAELSSRYDVVVVGAGPAGLAAAAVCARAGLATALFDEQSAPGGQIYRAVTTSPFRVGTVLEADYWRGAALVREALASGVSYFPRATAWGVFRQGELAVSIAGVSHLVEARRIILATGALERPFPVPGWTLPGVMTCGAAQILLKSAGVVPRGPTVVAGTGPLIWLLAWQYLQAGVRIDTLLDTTSSANWGRAWRHAASFALSPYFHKGLRLARVVRRSVRTISGVAALRIEGTTAVEAVIFAAGSKAEQHLAVRTLLLHQGIAPHVNLAMSAGIPHRWNQAQLCWEPICDADGSTARADIAIAGDGAGIAGAEMAQARGHLAGVAVASALGAGDLVNRKYASSARAVLNRFSRGRAFLDLVFQPAPRFRIPDDETIVCRCEEVTAGQIRQAAALGCPGPNQMKAFLRCGMGPCQGRLCGLTVTEVIAAARATAPEKIGYFRLRPPVKPVTVAELAGLPTTEAAVKAVAREE